jgi:hypothetical protein
MNHRDEQIGEQREGNQTDDKVFHKFPIFSQQFLQKPADFSAASPAIPKNVRVMEATLKAPATPIMKEGLS